MLILELEKAIIILPALRTCEHVNRMILIRVSLRVFISMFSIIHLVLFLNLLFNHYALTIMHLVALLLTCF